jgi:hypothetical protein
MEEEMGCFVLCRLVGGFVVGLEESVLGPLVGKLVDHIMKSVGLLLVVSLALSAVHLDRAVDLSAARLVDSLTGLFGDLMVV